MATQLFWDRIAPKYARKPVDDPDAYEEKLALAASLLKPSDRVLEIGCGTGTTALRLAPNVAHYTATDGSSTMIGIADAKLGPGAPANVTFRHADAADQVAGAPFDAVCAFSLLHLVEDVPEVLAAVRAQLKTGRSVLVKDGVYEGRRLADPCDDPHADSASHRAARDADERGGPCPTSRAGRLHGRAHGASEQETHEPDHRRAQVLLTPSKPLF